MKAEWSVDPSEFADRSSPKPNERFNDVIDAVEDLPAELRDVVNAVFWERLSAPRAIASLGISPATFYRRLAEAKRRLVDVLRTDVSTEPYGDMGGGLEVLLSREAG